MVKSMTGFGKSTLSKEKREYQMEIKSVNHRYLDITIKMPKTLSYLEDEIKKEISSKIKRGKVDVYITYENGSQEGRNITINKELAKLYINQLLLLFFLKKLCFQILCLLIAYNSILSILYFVLVLLCLLVVFLFQ
jgi:uncharacterized protein (TIGR00255 family)